jgi:FlaA1/EpsC-like NDP-sugar epimerase
MSEQNFKNHPRYIPLWHFITSITIIAVLIGSIVNLFKSSTENLYSASLIVVIALILCSLFWYTRWFALRVQDRAIRAEESLRHFMLTGKPLDGRLRMGQIIALRFASDDEFPELALKAAEKGLRSKSIKKMIKIWRSDNYRA